MGDGQDCAIFEFGGDHFLDEFIILDIDVGGGFIDKDDLAFFEESSADAQELLLSN